MDEKSALQQEWVTLQNHHERYESGGLAIKLVAVVLAVPVVASLLQARVRTDSLAVVVLVRPLASQAFQPPMQAVAAVQLQRQVLVAVVVWVAQEAGVLVRVTG